MKIVFTGGHHSSALPVLDLLLNNPTAFEIFWFGHKVSLKSNKNNTLEFKEITERGVSFYDLKAGKLYKTFDLLRLLKVPFGFFHALYLLLKTRPSLIVSFGGYLAAPTVLAGWFLRIPSITHEQTLVPGLANKLIANFAKIVMISWPESEKHFPSEKVVVTGLPLRKSALNNINKNATFTINPELPTIYVTAGKTGAHVINKAVKKALPALLKKYNLIHQCGNYSVTNDFNDLLGSYKSIEKKEDIKGQYNLRQFVFEDEIGTAYDLASVVVCRAGAHTSAEILYVNKPALMIPIPWVSKNEQMLNAQMVKSSGLAEILEQKNLNSESLIANIDKMFSNLDEYKLKVNNYSHTLEMSAEQEIVNIIFEVLNINK